MIRPNRTQRSINFWNLAVCLRSPGPRAKLSAFVWLKQGIRVRFELIDQVVEQNNDHIVAVKNVTSAEEYLADHFPSFPVLPGVMMMEALVQAGRRLLADRGESGEPFVLGQVRNVRYGNMVRPGQSLVVEVTCKGCKDGQWEMTGVGRVDDSVAVQGKFSLVPLSEVSASSGAGLG